MRRTVMEYATVVTAYYPIPSKFSQETYLGWIRNFWPQTRCPLVFFTNAETAAVVEPILRGRAGPTQVWILEFSDLMAFQRLPQGIWVEAERKDAEKGVGHSAELYAMWYEKKEFVRRVIKVNPYRTETFVWCDAGIGRAPAWGSLVPAFPRADRVPRGKMLVLSIDPFVPEDVVCGADGIWGNFAGKNRVGGGILASDREGWMRWNMAYDAMLLRYWTAGRFIGKDQDIMASCILEDPSLCILCVPGVKGLGLERWFFLLFYLGGLCAVSE